MAERGGFEPPEQVYPTQQISNLPCSATPAPLRGFRGAIAYHGPASPAAGRTGGGRCSFGAVTSPATTRVFVYGTLKRGFPNHPLLERATLLGAARTCESWPLVIAGSWFVPCLLDRPGQGHRVRGEVYAVDAPTLADLDELEGVGEPDGYDRKPIEVEVEPGGERLRAQVYFKREPLGEIHGGWLHDYDDDRYVEPGGRS